VVITREPRQAVVVSDVPGRRARRRDVFVGEIAGIGTTSGHRLIVGRWPSSPFGSFTDLMHESPGGHRMLVAPTTEIAEYVSATYVFDEVRIASITSTRAPSTLRVDGGGWTAELTVGRRTSVGNVLRVVPRRLATAPWWCTAIDPVARRAVRGVRTRGTAAQGRVEWYGATDQRRVVAARCTLEGVDLGALADVWPPVRFGFSSTPRRPSIVSVTTTIEHRH
jgi:hypothetical protein